MKNVKKKFNLKDIFSEKYGRMVNNDTKPCSIYILCLATIM